MHAFVQEGLPNEAVQKLEDLDRALAEGEATNVGMYVYTAGLFACVSCRQPRALQICARMLDRALKVLASSQMSASQSALTTAQVLCQLGSIHIKQGPSFYERALKCFRDATKKDAGWLVGWCVIAYHCFNIRFPLGNISALEGMILTQLR